MIKPIKYCFTIFLLISITAKADDIPAVSKGDLKFYVDYSSFAGKESKTSVEFYFMLFADQLVQKNENGKTFTAYKVNSSIKKINEERIHNKEWTTEAAISIDTANSLSRIIYDQYNEMLLPGKYYVKFEITDIHSGVKGEAELEIDVRSYTEDGFTSSQIQFSSQVKNNVGGHFVKSNREIIPSPSRRFGLLNPVMYLYYELYNIPGKNGDEFIINYSAVNDDGKIIKSFPEVSFIKQSATVSLVHGLNTGTIPSGIYILKAVIKYNKTGNEITFNRKFEVIQKDYLTNQPLIDESQVETGGKLIKYIASPEQYSFYESLNSAGKLNYLINYWKDLDPTPGTAENEYLDKIKQRFNYANENFKWGNNEGWSSERGRVLIKYGMPDEIERYYNEAETVPFEIWVYRQEKSYLFVFGDLNSNGRFLLVHSTKEGEVYNSNWKEYLGRM